MRVVLLLLIGFGGFIFAISTGSEPHDQSASGPLARWVEAARQAKDFASNRYGGVTRTVGPEEINWYGWSDKDPVFEEPLAVLVIDADSRSIVNPGQGWERPHLVIRCARDLTAFYVVWGLPLGAEEKKPQVTYSIDKGPARLANWNLSGNHQATGLWRNQGINFLKGLSQEGKDLTIRLADDDSEVLREASFNIESFKEKIRPLRETCAW